MVEAQRHHSTPDRSCMLRRGGAKQGQATMPVESLHYGLCRQERLEVRHLVKRRRVELQGAAPEPALGSADKKMLHPDFFAMCRAPETRDLSPFPGHLEGPCGISKPMWKPGQCLRQLALIKLAGKEYQDLPQDHDALLSEVCRCRALEE